MPTTQPRFTPVPYRCWRHTSGRAVSIHGAVPYVRDAESEGWRIEERGFTIYDSFFGTYGCSRPPSPTLEEAQALCDKFNAR